jgi:hypothetical protein
MIILKNKKDWMKKKMWLSFVKKRKLDFFFPIFFFQPYSEIKMSSSKLLIAIELINQNEA